MEKNKKERSDISEESNDRESGENERRTRNHAPLAWGGEYLEDGKQLHERA